MRVLVTGATGFVGSRLVETLRSDGHRVVTVSRGAKGDYDSILSAVIEIKDIEARRKNFLIASKQSGQVDAKSLMKTNASGDKEHKLQDMVSEKGWRITEYLNDYFEDGDEPDGLLGW